MVCDTGSSDATVEIAVKMADRIEHQEWIDFTTNKRIMTEQALNNWVFVLDADEQISRELRNEINSLTASDFQRFSVMMMPRKNYLLGRHVRAWDPDWQTRLFDRTRTAWLPLTIHEKPVPLKGEVKRLNGQLLHNVETNDWLDYFAGPRYEARTDTLAREMFRQGARAGYLKLLLFPFLTFWKFYLRNLGFLQGKFGVLIAQKAAFGIQLKYARLWHLLEQEKQAKKPY
jgi:glycosyltransferase involved in cell wall biosynthesis